MDTNNSSTKWYIGLASWIIQDGNYPDFSVGQTAEFALEFWLPKGSSPQTSGAEPSAVNVEHCKYDTVSKVVLQADNMAILDIGILVYQESPSSIVQSSLPQGNRFAVQLGLGVDPFFYFESLSKLADIPPFIYSWKILSIQMQTAPFIKKIRVRLFCV